MALTSGSLALGNESPSREQRPRVVLLGASNVAKGIATIVSNAQAIVGTNLELFCAYGHGRSYGLWTNLLGRGIPSILNCGLWEALDRMPPAPTVALLTDVGNDILYDVTPEQIVEWVRGCLSHLSRQGAKFVVTGLPIAGVQHISRRRFLFFRTLFFPRCRLTRDDVVARAIKVNELLAAAAGEYQFKLFVQPDHWYGLDPIHIRYSVRPKAWGEILSHWTDKRPPPAESGGFRRFVHLRTRSPAIWSILGINLRGKQPCSDRPGGMTISYY